MEERSAGAVVFFEDGSSGRSYLLLLNGGRWDFPKGNMEKGEEELDTVIREVNEETGLSNLSLVPGFRRMIEYSYRRGGKPVHKQVVYMLARADSKDVRISHEHQGFGWYAFGDAMSRASYDNSKNTLSEAERFLSSPTEVASPVELRTAPKDGAPTASRP